MDHFIIGTAGHVDHGKTALIKALTGTDTDSMPEEKKRGISIDLGFTYFLLPSKKKAGIIDVPGHEKFLPNMLAGVCGMDLVLLVIAADEGLMPQTWEHIEILNQLNIKDGIIVLSKCDLVEDGWPELMKDDIHMQLLETICGEWPIIEVSATTQFGIDKLISLIDEKSKTLCRNRSVNGRFRMHIDRVLSPKGIGTVVAGTLLEGSLHEEDDVMLYPDELPMRIKSMQVHGAATDIAHAGQRVAISLAGVDKSQIKRGNVIAYPNSLSLSNRMDVMLNVAKGSKRVVKNQSRVHVHMGTLETIARVVLLEKDEVKAGDSALGQLIFQENVTAKKGDKFVIRFLSPLETIGGGTVILPTALKHKRFDIKSLDLLRHMRDNKLQEAVQKILQQAVNYPLSFSEIVDKSGDQSEDIKVVLEELCCSHEIIRLSGKKQDYYWEWDSENRFCRKLLKEIQDYHDKNYYSPGITKLMVKTSFLRDWDNSAVDAYISYLTENGKLKSSIYLKESYYSHAAFNPLHREQENTLLNDLQNEIVAAGFMLANVNDIAHENLNPRQYEQYLGFLVRQQKIVHIKDELYTSPEIAAEIVDLVANYFKENEILSFASLRDLLGISRKTSKPLMAWLDDMKITAWCGKETERRQGDDLA